MGERADMYARTLDEMRRSFLLAAGAEIGLELAPDLPIGNKSIGFYDRATITWSEPE